MREDRLVPRAKSSATAPALPRRGSPAPGVPGSASVRGEASAADGFGRYLQEIGRVPLLSPGEEQSVARRLRGAAARRREALAHAPATARLAVERWRDLRRRGRSPNRLGPRPGNGGAAEARRLDRALGRLERRLAGSGGHAGPSSALEREALGREALAAQLGEPVYDEAHALLRRLHDDADRAARRRDRRALRAACRCAGLSPARLRSVIREADAARGERDAAARELAARNLRLVVSAARRFQGLGLSLADLVQEGNLGLLRAVERFEPERGHRFSTYALWWIRQSLVRAVQNQARTVRLPTHMHERLFRHQKVAGELSGRLGREPSDGEVARSLGEEPGAVEHLRGLRGGSLSLHADSEDGGRPLEDSLPDPGQERTEEALDARLCSERVLRLLDRLGREERHVVCSRYGFGAGVEVDCTQGLARREPRSLEEIARELGTSRERVRMVEQRALARLRHWAGGTQEGTGRGGPGQERATGG